MRKSLIRKHAAAAPRYTSYPTAPHFHPGIGAEEYRAWLKGLAPGSSVSLYVHIPFCDTLCWFCGCHTKHTLRYEPVAQYLVPLQKEIETVASLVPRDVRVTSIQWGGGSPTILEAEDILRLGNWLTGNFTPAQDCEFGIEIDPRGMTEAKVAAMAKAGCNRASIGVQDFDPAVQKAVNRLQSYEETRDIVAALRAAGIGAINIDCMYGLPGQTRDSVADTVSQVLSLKPSRIAMFGYAHVPWLKPHMKMIDEAALPGPEERFAQANRASSLIAQAGYVRIGLDHFALPDDPMAQALETGSLKRNFQGYTTDTAPALLGFGASAIGRLPSAYVQNAPANADYARRVAETGLATVRGIALSDDDRMRGYAIERLMCEHRLIRDELLEKFPDLADELLSEIEYLADNDPDRLIERTDDGFAVTSTGRPFVRAICASFDPYFAKGTAKHSIAV
ncbi:MAG: oxygen-independent coproporphyrinogen III oxidase [Hyphomicrobiales bacterium]